MFFKQKIDYTNELYKFLDERTDGIVDRLSVVVINGKVTVKTTIGKSNFVILLHECFFSSKIKKVSDFWDVTKSLVNNAVNVGIPVIPDKLSANDVLNIVNDITNNITKFLIQKNLASNKLIKEYKLFHDI